MRYQKIPTYKYRLIDDEITELGSAFVGQLVNTPFITLKDCILTIRKGYTWDGASGPAIDTQNFMRGSLVHDALWQLIAGDMLPLDLKKPANDELVRICSEDGMSWLRCRWVKLAVDLYPVSKYKPPVTYEI